MLEPLKPSLPAHALLLVVIVSSQSIAVGDNSCLCRCLAVGPFIQKRDVDMEVGPERSLEFVN